MAPRSPSIPRWRHYPMVGVTILVLAIVVGLELTGYEHIAKPVASTVALLVAVWTAFEMVRDMIRGHLGLDVLAVIAIVSTVVVGEYIAAMIIVLMLTGGEALEDYAADRARRELDALLSRAPQRAHRVDDAGGVTEIDVTEVRIGDRLLIRPAEVVPVDGNLLSDEAEFDESSITGESLPRTAAAGEVVLSGAVNQRLAVEIEATATSANSQYQQIVNLVAEASASRAPVVRLADRYAVPFTLVSLAIAGVAWWLSGDPVRFAEVLVLATPCPLLIAAPVSFLSGMSRAAKAGIIVKGGAYVEQLARIRTAAFDKTGTLTDGRPQLVDVRPAPGFDEREVLQLAGSAEQYSTHALAASVQQAALDHDLELSPASTASEYATNGVRAVIDGRDVVVGKQRFVAEHATGTPEQEGREDTLSIFVAADGRYAGTLHMRDTPRANAAATIDRLRDLGVRRTLILTGDVQATAEHVAGQVGLSDVEAGLLPQDKVRLVAEEPERPVLMVGDGVNDAPVLAAADVGVAMGARGATAASESADVVILADDISKVAAAVEISKRTVRVALSSIWVGIALSVVLMLIAALGHIPAVVGALTQEVVDLVAILYALAARRPGRHESADQIAISRMREGVQVPAA